MRNKPDGLFLTRLFVQERHKQPRWQAGNGIRRFLPPRRLRSEMEMKMLIVWIFAGAAAFFLLQGWVYQRFWSVGLGARLTFSRESAVEGEECFLLEQVENRKLLPLPALKVKFRVSRKLRFLDEGDSAVTDQYYRNDILSLGPNQRVIRKLPLRCAARGFYPVRGLDLVACDLFLTRQMVMEMEGEGVLYVYPRPASGAELDSAVQKLTGELLVKRHLMEDPFEYRGLREYAPFDEMKSVNWKATARMGTLMVNMHHYTALRAVRIFLNLEDSGIWKNEELLELCIRIGVRIAGELLRQGIRVAVYCNGADALSGEPMRLLPSSGEGHLERINRAFARLDLEASAYPFGEVFAGELMEEGKDMAAVFLSVDRSPAFQETLSEFAAGGGDFTWMCPLFPRMETLVEDEERLHFIRLNAEEMLNG